MSRLKGSAGLASLIESDSEPDFDSFEATSIEALREPAPPRTTSRNAMRGRLVHGRVAKPSQRLASRKRGSAASPIDMSINDALESVDNNSALATTRGKGQRGRPKAPKSVDHSKSKLAVSVKGRRGRPPKGRVDETLETELQKDAAENLQHPMELDTVENDNEESIESFAGRAGLAARENQQDLDIDEKENESLAQGQLKERITRHDHLEAKHKELRDHVAKEAERNYERLKKQSAEVAKTAAKLIAELKAELAAQTKLARHGQALQRQLDLKDSKCSELESQVDDLNTNLIEARTEIKSLSTKLSASRNIEANKAPGSALKGAATNATSASNAIKTAQAKEDLYGDLTGLIVRGLQHHGEEDVFDCIQTGRNGTLHFKLALDTVDSVDSYEDVQYTYKPQLDPSRDGDLMDILPNYLVEEITFPRPQASRFYARVMKFLTDKLE